MIAAIARGLPRPHLSGPTVLRMIAAGTGWGVIVAAGMMAPAYRDCGVCLDDVVVTGATSLLVGILTVGPIALFGPAR